MKAVTKALFMMLLGALAHQRSVAAVIYANSQNTGSGGLCVGCSVTNPANSTDGNGSTYSEMNLTVSTLGAYVYQNVFFPSAGTAGQYVGFVVEDANLGTLNASVLGGLSITTFNGGSSNNDAQNSTALSIHLLGGSTTRYYVEFPVSSGFDQVQIRMNAGILGALSSLRIYYAYYNSSPLPVELVYFRAEKQGRSVNLSWATSVEINNGSFTVERSSDGVHFTGIQEIKGQGNSSGLVLYSYQDAAPQAINYYRLKQTDFNGSITLSSVVPVEFLADMQITTSGGYVCLTLPRELFSPNENLYVQVYSLRSGQLLYAAGIREISTEIELPAATGAGPYSLVLSSGKQVLHHRKFAFLE
jgi:hypothetical protein